MLTEETGAEQGAAEGQSATETEEVNLNDLGGGADAQAGDGGDETGGEAGAAGEGGEDGQPGSAEAAAAEGAAEPEPPPKKQSRALQQRINDLTKRAHDAERALEAERAERAKSGAAPAAEAGAERTAATGAGGEALVPISEVPKYAAQIAQANAFTEKCNTLFEAGEKAFGGDFESGVEQLQLLGVINPEPAGIGFVEAVLLTDTPEKVLHHLGQEPDEALRLSKLPPMKLAAEMVKLATKLNAPKPAAPVSRAPAPISPVGGAAKPDLDVYDPKLSDDEYYARRAKSGAKYMVAPR